MSNGFPSRLVLVATVSFVAGAGCGFAWALVRPAPPSAYRVQLEEQRIQRESDAP